MAHRALPRSTTVSATLRTPSGSALQWHSRGPGDQGGPSHEPQSLRPCLVHWVYSQALMFLVQNSGRFGGFQGYKWAQGGAPGQRVGQAPHKRWQLLLSSRTQIGRAALGPATFWGVKNGWVDPALTLLDGESRDGALCLGPGKGRLSGQALFSPKPGQPNPAFKPPK